MGFLSNFFDPSGGKATAEVQGFSANVNERQQRLQEQQSINSARTDLDVQSILNQFIGGGQFQQGSLNNGLQGNFESQPTGPLFDLINRGLGGEQALSRLRQEIAQQQLHGFTGNNALVEDFSKSSLNLGGQSLKNQNQLLNQSLGTFDQNQQLNSTLDAALQDFFGTGGEASVAQQQNIGNIFNAQRQVGVNNLQQQFGGALQQLQDQATTRGLRFGDTPIQDRGGALAQEFARNLTNLEAGIGGQEANALLQAPLQQAQLGSQLQGQTQGNLLNILNAFSTPVAQGFNSGSQLNQNNQFGLQFSPQQFSAPALANVSALSGSFQPTQVRPSFTGGNVIGLSSRGGEVTGQAFGQSFGSELGSSAGQATGGSFGGF